MSARAQCQCGGCPVCRHRRIAAESRGRRRSLLEELEQPIDPESGALFDAARADMLTPLMLERERGIRRLGHLPAMS